MMKRVKIILIALCALLTSCGSFGEGMLAALAGYNPYSYGYGNAYSSGYPSGYSSGYSGSSYPSSYSSSSYSSSYSSSSSSSSYSSSSSKSSSCPSLKASNGKWYCANTGKCGMCGGDGMMDGSFGQGANSLKCTLCGGSGKCKYCR